MANVNYDDWMGAGIAHSGMVHLIDKKKQSGNAVPANQWGSLEDYIPKNASSLGAERMIGIDGQGKYLKVLLFGGWNARLKPRLEELKFRFPKDPVYVGTHPNLNGYTIHRMEADKQIAWDVDEWEPIARYKVELFRSFKGSSAPNYSLKFYFSKVNGSDPAPGTEIGAFWCWA